MPRSLTFHQYKVLRLLAQRSQWTLKDIAQILQVSKSAASKCISRLAKQGVIQKEMRVDKQQYMNIRITQDGVKAIAFMSTQKFLGDSEYYNFQSST
jgi:DNA-binding MarR family transcriptional regulator